MKISESVLFILGQCRVEGNTLYLPNTQLDRSDYVAVNKVLEALGGKWNRKAKGHVFDYDPEEALEAAIISGEVTDTKKVFQFFETPSELAERLCDMAEINADSIVLEPSCGKGRIADAVWRRKPKYLLGVELNPDMKRYLAEKPYGTLVGQDFLMYDPADHCIAHSECEDFNRIVMNPPFAQHQDAIHVRRAYELLAPGGVLVAITGVSFKFRADRIYENFRGFLEQTGAEVFDLPAGTFKDSGTMVPACIIKIKK